MFNPAFNKPKLIQKNSYAFINKINNQLPTSDVEKRFFTINLNISSSNIRIH